jgi:predicted lipoprotein
LLYLKPQLLSIAVFTALTLSACGQDSSSTAGSDFNQSKDTDTEFNQLALITNLTDNVITPTFEAFQQQAIVQNHAVIDYCAAEKLLATQETDQGSVNTLLTSAQQQWRATMDIWQQAELMLVGPLVEQDGLLRDKIYSWPIVNVCAVDYDVVYFKSGTVNGQPYDISQRTPSRKGLAALDYLLFAPSLEHSCAATAPPPSWDTFDESTRKVARCNFATAVAQDIENNASSLVELWLASDGYANELKNAGTTGNTFITEHDAVNRLSDAFFYLDSSTKDAKLATPLGLFANECGSQVCPDAVESIYSKHSLNNILNNLIGFKKLLTGEDGIGFIDYLIDVGDESGATQISAGVNQAIESVNLIETSLTDALVNDVDKVTKSHKDVKSITDQLKADFINSLALELPATSAGDND